MNKFKFDLQLFGGGTSVQQRELSPEEKQLIAQNAEYMKSVQPAVNQLVSQGTAALNNVVTPDYSTLYKDASGNVANTTGLVASLANGQLPQSYIDNKTNYYNQLYNNSFGSILNNSAGKGVINSSVLNKSIDSQQKNLDAQASNDFTKDISTQSGLLTQKAGTDAAQLNLANLANASSFGNASQYLGLASGQANTGNQALSSIGNVYNGATTVTQDPGFLGGLMSGVGSYLKK